MLNESTVGAYVTDRNSFHPRTFGIFTWRSVRNRIPVRLELDKRGIDLDSVRCPVCDESLETVSHAIIECNLAKDVWDRVRLWWGVSANSNDTNTQSIFNLEQGNHRSNDGHKIWQAVKWVSGYLIWRNRNLKVFQNKCKIALEILSEIQVKSFE
ncbi:uncharacterized protein [Rutidosis leptorrhynchoides]|uniref:uncharacterized protein n=1 Tax=Rutidosis leptorrhynchoides TaxID=125765 RepID=UPI003A991F94